MKSIIKLILIVLNLTSLTNSLYDASSSVVQITTHYFDKYIKHSHEVWLIEFYTLWCGHCKNVVPEFTRAAKALKGVVKVGVVECDEEETICTRYAIRGFPAIKFYGEDKTTPEDYYGSRTAESIIDFTFEKARALINFRLSKKPEARNTYENITLNTTMNQQQYQQYHQGHQIVNNYVNEMIELTDKTYNEKVFSSKHMWIITFYDPWCGRSQKILPEMKVAATQLKGKVKFARIDATINLELSERYNIIEYPTIKIFPPGDKYDSTAEEYQGPKDYSGIAAYALNKLEDYGIVPIQIVNENVLKDTCQDKNGICIICFLPNITKSSARERNNYISLIKEVSKQLKDKPIYYLWAQGGDYLDFENIFQLNSGYPAAVAINFVKKNYSIFRQTFNAQNLKEFVANSLIEKEPLHKLNNQLPKLKNVKGWDGKDYELPNK